MLKQREDHSLTLTTVRRVWIESGESHDVEDDGQCGRDEHDGRVDLVIVRDDALHSEVHQNTSHNPNHKHRHQCSHHL